MLWSNEEEDKAGFDEDVDVDGFGSGAILPVGRLQQEEGDPVKYDASVLDNEVVIGLL